MTDIVLITTMPLTALREGLGRPCTTNFLYNQMLQSSGQNCTGYKVGLLGYSVFAVLILIFKFVIKCFRLGIPATQFEFVIPLNVRIFGKLESNLRMPVFFKQNIEKQWPSFFTLTAPKATRNSMAFAQVSSSHQPLCGWVGGWWRCG